MKYIALFLLLACSLLGRAQKLSLKDIFKIYTSDSVTTKHLLAVKGFTFFKDSTDSHGYEVKEFNLPEQKSPGADTLLALWNPNHRRGLMVVQYKFDETAVYNNILKDIQNMGGTVRSKLPVEKSIVYSFQIPGYDIFCHLSVNSSIRSKYMLMISTPRNKMDSDLK